MSEKGVFSRGQAGTVRKRDGGRYHAVTTIQDDDDNMVTVIPSSRQQRRRQPEPSLVLALLKTFWPVLLSSAFFKLIQDLLNFVGPQVLK